MALYTFNDIGIEGTTLKREDELGSTSEVVDNGVDMFIPHSRWGNSYFISVVTNIPDKLIDYENSFYSIDGVERSFIRKSDTETRQFEVNVKAETILIVYCVVEGLAGGSNESEVDIIGFNNVYVVDKSILVDLASERFELYIGDGKSEYVDLGEYIINVLQLPFKIDDSLILEEGKINLGHAKLETLAPKLSTDRIVLDLGSITIPIIHNNSFDYLNSEIVLHLPFTDPIDLDIGLVMGEAIHIIYIVDLYTGDTTINISTTKNQIIKSQQTKIGREIPFMKSKSSDIMSNNQTSSGIDNGVDNAFIELNRFNPFIENDFFNELIKEYGILSTFTGSITVDEINLETTATLVEKNNILNILTNGVFINE